MQIILAMALSKIKGIDAAIHAKSHLRWLIWDFGGIGGADLNCSGGFDRPGESALE